MKKSVIFNPDYDWYNGIPQKELLFNPLTDIERKYKEENEMTEFYKLGNEFYSPAFGIKYLLNMPIYPIQMAIIHAMLSHKFPLLLMTRGGGKTTLLAVYAIMSAILNPGKRIILVSAGFRQSKLIFREMNRIYNKAPLLQLIADSPKVSTDRCYFDINTSSIVALPLGQGDKIRGERGHIILVDEFEVIPPHIFDVVVRGFAATQSDPYQKTKEYMLAKKEGRKNDTLNAGNKIVLSGTAGFRGGNFYKIFNQYSKIIGHKIVGNVRDYKDLIGIDTTEDIQIDHRQYCIIRYKYTDLPPCMLEEEIIHNARMTMPKVLFDMEYNAEFGDDTSGFFKFKDIDEATSKTDKPNAFDVSLKGKSSSKYILGVDPARTTDRFAISLIELGMPNKLVYLWTCQNQKYSYGVQKMRDMMRSYNIVGISMDAGGGGLAIEEMLQSPDFMNEGDRKIFRHDDENVKITEGNKILYMFDFSSAWIEDANTLLQKNIEDKLLMFPNEINGDTSEDMEEALEEISGLKKELISIEITYTKTGKKHFDLMPPDITTGEEAVRHKDRYSSLLLANYLASRMGKLKDSSLEKISAIYNDPRNFGGWSDQF